MTALNCGDWIPKPSRDLIESIAESVASHDCAQVEREIHQLIVRSDTIHNIDCINLNPATNIMNPTAEVVLASGIGVRPSLGYPGDKYEMGLEAIERIEVIAQELACEVFNARFAELRVASGAMANLYAFMATCRAGDNIIVPPAELGGHVTHHENGAAGLYGLNVHYADADSGAYIVDIEKLGESARKLKPKLITVGGSLNLQPHPIREIRAVADEVGAKVLFDAAHLSGLIAGKCWQQPLDEGAHMMTMSAYKSLGGPPTGIFLTSDDEIAQRVDAIAFPGLTANFDAAKTASLALALLDWKEFGADYAKVMMENALSLALACQEQGLPVYRSGDQITQSHQFAIEAAPFGGGQNAAKRLRRANILTSGIGLPIDEVAGDMNGLRLGTPEITRWGFKPEHMPQIAAFMADALLESKNFDEIANDVTSFRSRFDTLEYVRVERQSG